MDKQQNELKKSYFRARKQAVDEVNVGWKNHEYIHMIDNKMVDIDKLEISDSLIRMFYSRPDFVTLFADKLNNLSDNYFMKIIQDNHPLLPFFIKVPILKNKMDNFSDETLRNPNYGRGMLRHFMPRINNLSPENLLKFIENKGAILGDLKHLSNKITPDDAIVSLKNSYPYEKVVFFEEQILDSLGSENLLRATNFRPRLRRHIWYHLAKDAMENKKIKMTMLPLYDGSFAYGLDSNREKNVMDYKGNVVSDKGMLQKIRNNIDVHDGDNMTIAQRIDDLIKNG